MTEALEKTVRNFLAGNSLFIQGNDEEKWRNTPEELRQAIIGYFQGKGISIKILKKYHGYGGSLRITPSEAELRAAIQAPF